MQFPRLYKPTKSRATQICDISVEGAVVITTFGQLNGKLQTSTDTCSPKNVGKSNETTAEAQALLEAQSKFDKKKKSGYSETISLTPTVQLPQKVKNYREDKHLVTYPCYILPKFNGVNGTYWLLPDGTLKLTSRGGDELPAIPHLEPYIRNKMQQACTTCLNGELYIKDESLQNITSAIKKPKELSKQLQFLIFEFPLIATPFSQKISLLDIPVAKISTEQGLEELYKYTVSTGLEGIVIYNSNTIYKFNERSSSVLKYKPVLDAEYIIRSYTLDRRNHPVFTCETPSGSTFKVKPKGTDAERKQIVKDFDTLYKDQFYTIEYEMLSDSDIPLKPVGIGLRSCDPSGNPKE